MRGKQKVKIIKNGPYLVSGGLPLAIEVAIVGSSGEPEEWKRGSKYAKQDNYSLCRCGLSYKKPFCDGSHSSGFNGKETASKEPYSRQAEKIKGPELDLTDVVKLCSLARFCHLGESTWNDVESSNEPKAKKNAISSACNCPSGRLVVWDKKTGKPLEHNFSPSVSLLEDPQAGVSGPIWVKGGVDIVSADGIRYEIRNRVTLCRCGRSKNKPFCDGSHIRARFNDGDESLKRGRASDHLKHPKKH